MRSGRFLWIVLALIAAAAIYLLARDTLTGSARFGRDGAGYALYLGILALVIGAGLLRAGPLLGTRMRQFGLWILAILVLVVAYQYRYELQDAASRVTVGLVPGSPLSVTDADGRTTVTLQKSAGGHFEARVRIDGQMVAMLIDTGATTTVLSTADAAAIGFDPSALNFQVPVSTANGQALAARVVLDEIAVGAISRKRVPALVASDGMLDQSLLGMNFLGTLSGYDIRGDRMILRD